MCLPQNSPHAPSNYTGRHSAAKTPPHCHIIHTQLCGQAGVCVMFSWRSPVAACGSLRSRKFPSELSGSLTNPHTHPQPLPLPLPLPSEPCPRYLPAQPPTPSSAPCCCLSFLLLRRCRRCSLRVASALFLCTRRTCATSTATQTSTSTAAASWLIVSGGKC